jgi:hypothetical protein
VAIIRNGDESFTITVDEVEVSLFSEELKMRRSMLLAGGWASLVVLVLTQIQGLVAQNPVTCNQQIPAAGKCAYGEFSTHFEAKSCTYVTPDFQLISLPHIYPPVYKVRCKDAIAYDQTPTQPRRCVPGLPGENTHCIPPAPDSENGPRCYIESICVPSHFYITEDMTFAAYCKTINVREGKRDIATITVNCVAQNQGGVD